MGYGKGISILAALLEQFPVIASEDEEAERDVPSDLAMPRASTIHPIVLESWIIETAEPSHVNDEEQQALAVTEREAKPASDESEPCKNRSNSPFSPIPCQPSPAALLQTLPAGYQAPLIQIGFNFAESES